MKFDNWRINVCLNFLGNSWYAVLNFLCIPFYLHYLGVEAFGFIGIFDSLFAATILLDLGVSPAVNRRIAMLKHKPEHFHEINSLIWTTEVLYWLFAIIVCVILALLAPFFGSTWVNAESLSPLELKQAFFLMSLVIMFQLPNNLYSNVFLGLEKHVNLNVIRIISFSIRFGSTILALKFIEASLLVFFSAQLLASIFHIILLKVKLFQVQKLTKTRGEFSIATLLEIKQFAIGMGAMTITEFFLSQVDKIILSILLPLKIYGYYILAYSLAKILTLFYRPLSNVAYPKFSTYITQNEKSQLKNFYHNISQASSILIFPFTITLIFFAKDILTIWTRNEVAAENSYLLLILLIIGNCFYAILKTPMVFSLSNGGVDLIVKLNVIAIFFFVPWLLFATPAIGAMSSPIGWLTINLVIFLIAPILIHRKYLIGESFNWYINDNLIYVLAALIGPLFLKVLSYFVVFPILLVIALSFILSYAFCILINRPIRQQLQSIFTRI